MELISPENKKLVGNFSKAYFFFLVIDVHPEWCGPCEMLFPTYKSLLTTIDDFDKRVDIVMVSYLYYNLLI